ncbi:PREDICTED: serine/threonine-protein phosphatase CPPED1-like [Branchiostoma belcheri]|uniref:Serine/threonine-protein phosphatase CPPED1 n=1 Tax=Branchiostoma belcheri TaxID=7741 RepID=A0A6P4ZTI5_BRABE|nr:PREDICTED: serine/threonine-protein phosphatase CPPED1-like [Branchiostoma belcheri]
MASSGDPEFVKKAKNHQFEGFTKELEGEWQGPFVFIQAADTQYGMINDWEGRGDGNEWEEEMSLTKKAIQAANTMEPRPKFFIVCGDLVHAWPGGKYREEQERDLKATFTDLRSDIPLVCVCGNHDVGNSPTQESILKYRDSWGDDYFSFWVGGVKFLVINSSYFPSNYSDPSVVGELKKEHDDWLDTELEEAKSSDCQHLVIFQHIPWFLKSVDEDNEYFNIDRDVRKTMLAKFKEAGVRTIFCGHYHRNAGAFYDNMEHVITSAVGCQLGKDKSGLRVVKVTEDAVAHQYYDMDSIPQKVDF